MFISRFSAWFPTGRTLVTVIASALVGGSATFGIAAWLRSHEGANAAQPGHDAHFAALGRAYLPQLALAYSRAWDQGAAALDSGQPVSAAIDLVAKNWMSGRTALFDKLVAPELGKIVPESIKDSDVTQAERTALAAAWRRVRSRTHAVSPLSFVPCPLFASRMAEAGPGRRGFRNGRLGSRACPVSSNGPENWNKPQWPVRWVRSGR